jgi:hypothetical protein
VSVFNRVVVVVISVVILVGAVVTLLVSTGVSNPDILPFGWFETQLTGAAAATGGSAAIITIVSGIIALGLLILIIFEFIPIQKAVSLLISSNDYGIVTIDRESVCLLAEKTSASFQNVRSAKCSLVEGTEGLVISCRPSVALITNIPELSVEVQAKIKEIVEQLTGLAVAQVNIKAKYETGEARRLAVR